ncbi:MFS transporter [Rhodococcus sp. TAF43]|uniref:MFS transporter n=1 Tax=unclassified Rhodococcus (in: high G+C Gram-positive bacteria) TaxID=192944 RepID=UPI000E0C4E9B|nr:MFS transporter [Rhodococcus sp. AG1013]RDI30617.1 MFS transporter [Rhodococcus sp. AG1013]
MDSSASTARSGGIVTVLAVAGIVAALMQTLVVPLIGDLPRILDTTASNASWVITITLLVGAVATPVTGRLGDLLGKRRMLLFCSFPLAAGSVMCALADSLAPMVIGRGLQGLGMGMVPLGISALRELVPPQKLGSSIALISATLGIGGALGLPISAAVTQNTSWRVLFWGCAVLSVVIGVLIWRLIPATPAMAAGGRFDYVGAIGLGAGLVSLLLAVSKGAVWGWGSASILGLFAAAVIVLLAWGWWELRTSDPLVNLRLAAGKQVLLTNSASVVVGFSMYAQSLIIPQLLQLPESTGYGLGQSMLAMGLWMLPGGFVMMAVSPLGAKLSAARGPKVTLVLGALVIAFGYGSSMLLLGSTWGLLVVVCISNAGVGLAYGAMPALIMGAVPPSATGSANSFNTLMRSVGTSVAAAVVGVVLAQMSVDVGGHTMPTEAGFRTGLLIGCGVALVAAAIASAIPGRKPAASTHPVTADVDEKVAAKA